MKCVVYIGTSLDGFIARPDGALDFLDSPDNQIEGEDFGYQKFMDSVDGLLMGRKTFEAVIGFGIGWPYGEKPVYVYSNSLERLPDANLPDHVRLMNGTLNDVLDELERTGHKKIYCDGGRLIQSLLRAGRIDEMTISRVPVLIGSGIPLFGPLAGIDIVWKHKETRSFANGLVQSVYSKNE